MQQINAAGIDPGIATAIVSILVALMIWLLGLVRNLRPKVRDRSKRSPMHFVVPAVLYGTAILTGFVGLFLTSYVILPSWSDSVLVYPGILLIIVQAVAIILAPFIADGMENIKTERSARILVTGHGLGAALFSVVAYFIQSIVDWLTALCAIFSKLGLPFALLIAALIMFLAYLGFMWMMGRTVTGKSSFA